MSIPYLVTLFPGIKRSSRLGKTRRDISRERAIIIAVSTPKVANIGIGAKVITTNPTIVVKAALKRA